MGGSVSKNATKVVINAIAKISSKIVQDTKIGYDSSQVIYIKDTKGDVIIRGNKMIQRANLNMNALFNAMSSESAQQNLALELSQSAKALTSGLNIGQYSDAENDLDVFIQTSIELSTVISQSCTELAKQEQKIIIEHTIGSVIIENNVFEQMADMFSSCIQTSISNSDALQSIILKLTQDSSATSQGLSPWVLVALLAVVIGVPTAGAVVIGKDILKYIFPIMSIVGIVLIVYYYSTRKTEMPIKAYSKLIENTHGCIPDPPHPQPFTTYDSVEAAAHYCNATADCKAFDWKGIDISQTGSYTLVTPPQTKFYKSVESGCRSQIGEDNANLMRTPILYFGAGAPHDIPNLIKGDVWIDTTTSVWYQLTTTWIKNNAIVEFPFSKITVQKQPPTSQSGVDNEYVIVYDETAPTTFVIYKYSKIWIKYGTVPGPGYFAFSPSAINASGVKESSNSSWLLYTGAGCIVLGILGTIFMTKNMTDKNAK